MLDENCRPILIEVNHSPSFSTETKFDEDLKFKLIQDTLLLLNISPKNK